ncbi:hypothetical protein, conserved [Eimeria brunetti]|uniref:Uncharacterized protein n=1 Tax=Eimeria brunetti TaxID=51314 RepID=U6LD49_9EIME|nr:hypothetical protein, conserved [Eimeria brunetti]
MEQEGGPLAMAGALEGPREALKEAEKIFDRQIRIWGFEAQKKLMRARVLFIGMSAINVEASKDLALAGVPQTLCDGRQWGESCGGQPAGFGVDGPFSIFHVFRAGEIRGLIVSQCCGSIGFFVQDLGLYEVVKKETKEKTMFSHPPLLDVLQAKIGELDRRVNPAIFAVLALLRWEEGAKGKRPPLRAPGSEAAAGAAAAAAAAAAAEIEAAAERLFAAEGLKETDAIRCATRQLAEGFNQQSNTIGGIVGGIICQEIRKFITREEKAIPNVIVFDGATSCAAVARGGGDLTADARLVTEHVELLAWYLQNDRLAVAHVAICLLEGPHKEISRAVIDKCQGDYEFIRYSVKDFIVDLPRSSVRHKDN